MTTIDLPWAFRSAMSWLTLACCLPGPAGFDHQHRDEGRGARPDPTDGQVDLTGDHQHGLANDDDPGVGHGPQHGHQRLAVLSIFLLPR